MGPSVCGEMVNAALASVVTELHVCKRPLAPVICACSSMFWPVTVAPAPATIQLVTGLVTLGGSPTAAANSDQRPVAMHFSEVQSFDPVSVGPNAPALPLASDETS